MWRAGPHRGRRLAVGCGAASAVQTGSTPGPVVVRLAHSVPNPARSTARIDYALPATVTGEPVRLRIFDAAGRLVRTLAEGSRSTGEHSAVWDGTDDRGRIVPTGVYFYRLTVGTEQLTRKLLLAR